MKNGGKNKSVAFNFVQYILDKSSENFNASISLSFKYLVSF